MYNADEVRNGALAQWYLFGVVEVVVPSAHVMHVARQAPVPPKGVADSKFDRIACVCANVESLTWWRCVASMLPTHWVGSVSKIRG